MPLSIAVFDAVIGAAKSTKPTTSTGGSIESVLFIVILFGLAYVFFLRPRSQAARRQRETLMELSAGDEVLTGAGIYGTVLDVEPDRVTLETAPGTRITVVRSTIARKIVEPDANSVAEQNWQDEGHDGVAEAAGWHDPSEQEHPAGSGGGDEHDGTDDDRTHDDSTGEQGHASENGNAGHHGVSDEPEADGAPGATQGGGR
jgi:preprotein translocase subunit YajC